MPKTDPVDKRRVTMTNYIGVYRDKDGNLRSDQQVAVDYVRPDFLDAYVEAARKTWQLVEVSDEPDAGPGGYEGQTHVPGHIDHPLAGQTFGKD